jgi:hypothetical protein
VAKLFSRTGELIQIIPDEQRFEQAIERAAPGFGTLPAPEPAPPQRQAGRAARADASDASGTP